MGDLAVYAWSKPGQTNFGDELGPAILSRLGHRVRRVSLPEAEVVACGSILDQIGHRPGLVVWGAGFIRNVSRAPTGVDVRAVRGRLSAGRLAVDVTGDPGCVVPQLWDRPTVRHQVGWVPHYIDPRPAPWADITIDVAAPVDDVITQIGSCARIAASSLHALIVAQAWGIPTMRLTHPKIVGGDYKFTDYLSGDCDPFELLGVAP